MGKISKNELNTSLATKIEEIDLKANISDLETTNSQLAQIEYQTPTIVGTQIRLTKPSDNSRLFFKLETDLVGSITISLDNGATEKPLNDFEGVQLTSLDKGFVEVVAQATFFTLVKKGALKINGQDVIEGILQGNIDKFDAVYAEFIAGDLELEKLNNPSTLPSGLGVEITFSTDNTYLAVAHNTTPFLTIYKRNGNVYNKLPNPSVLPDGNARGVRFSPDSNYLAVAQAGRPFVIVYKRDGDVFNKLPDLSTPVPTGTGSNGTGLSFSPDGNYLAVALTGNPFIAIYKRSGDSFNLLPNPSVLPEGNSSGVDFSPDGTYLAVTHNLTPFITIYKRNNDIFTKLPNPSVLPTGQAKVARFSLAKNYLVIGHDTSPFVTIYKQEGDGFNKLPNPSVLPAGAVMGASFKSNTNFLVLGAYSSTPPITIYKITNNVFDVQNNPSILPPSFIQSVDFSSDDKYLAFASVGTPFIAIYEVNETEPAILISKSQNISDLQGKYGAGYLTQGGNLGDTREMVRIFK